MPPTNDDVLATLESGGLYWFRDWPNEAVPPEPGVYTVWQGNTLIYAGVSGRSQIEIGRARGGGGRVLLQSRLSKHAAGHRSSDQFCVYVSDRLVLPLLSDAEIESVVSARTTMDHLVKKYIHEHLGYRFVVMATSAEIRQTEQEIRRGVLSAGKPFLNPLD